MTISFELEKEDFMSAVWEIKAIYAVLGKGMIIHSK